LRIDAADNFNVEEASTQVQVELPKLSIIFGIELLDKVKSIFKFSGYDSDIDMTHHYYNAVYTDEENYDYFYDQSGKEGSGISEAGAQYNKVKFTATPCMRRSGKVFMYNVINPGFTWDIDPVPPLETYHPSVPTIVHIPPAEQEMETYHPFIGGISIPYFSTPVYKISEEELPNIMVADNLLALDNEEMTVECQVVNEVGETATVTETLKNSTGAREENIGRVNMLMTFYYYLFKYPDIFQGKNIDPAKMTMRMIPEPDPLPYKRIPAEHQNVLKQWNMLRSFIISNTERDLVTNDTLWNEFKRLNFQLVIGLSTIFKEPHSDIYYKEGQ
jgi:hypothetical protein